MAIQILFEEENLISLRSAQVCDDGHITYFKLSALCDMGSFQESIYKSAPTTYIFRRSRPLLARLCWHDLGEIQKYLSAAPFASRSKQSRLTKWIDHLLLRRMNIRSEREIDVRRFLSPPLFSVQWAESGHSVALYVNGEPWAFIHQDQNYGYSKGILKPTIGNPWNQELFERTFK